MNLIVSGLQEKEKDKIIENDKYYFAKQNREYKIFPTCATTGEGLYEAFDWFSEAIKRRDKH